MKVLTYSFFLCCLFLTACQDDGQSVGTEPAPAPAPQSTSAGNTTSSEALAGAVGESGFVPAGYEKVWSDEFDYNGLPDTTKWGYQTGGYGWTAKEIQNYLLADPDNVGVENGVLRITAIEEKAGRNPYSSTRLVTKRKADFTKGYFEVRAQVPSGPGLRSSFWMVGDTVTEIGWPYAGEIDLFEHYGKFPSVMNAAVQTPDNFWSKGNQMGGSKIIETAETAFHIYSLEWTDEQLTFAVDGEVFWTYLPAPGRGKAAYPFKWPFYMVASLSVGGIRGPQSPPVSEAFPASMYIDYVRVYQK